MCYLYIIYRGDVMNRKTGSNFSILIVAVLVIAALIILSGNNLLSTGYNLGGSCPTSFNGTLGCSTAQSYGSGGIVTSLSQATFATSSPFPSKAWLITVLANSGTGTLIGTQSQVASALNSSYKTYTNNPITINWALVNESYSVPYQNTGEVINYWGMTNTTLNYGVPQAGWGYPSCHGSFTAPYYYSLNCTNYLSLYGNVNQSFYSNLTNFASACRSANPSAVLAIINNSEPKNWFIITSTNAKFVCTSPIAKNPAVYAIYEAEGTRTLHTNVSVSFSNGTTSGQVYLTSDYLPYGYLDQHNNHADVYAAIIGYTFSGSDISNNFPVAIQAENNSKPYLTSWEHLSTALSYSEPNSGNWQPGLLGEQMSVPINNADQPVPYTYFLTTIQDNLVMQNQNIAGNLNKTLQPSSAYYSHGVNFNGNSGSLIIPLYNKSGANPSIGQVAWEPELQIVANVSTLSIYMPVPQSAPRITDITPNPLTITSGSTGDIAITVMGNQTGNYQAYISGSCSSGSLQTQFSVGSFTYSNNPTTKTVTITTPISTQNVTLQCSATVYSVTNPNLFSSYSFGANLNKVCSPQSVDYNNTTCKPYTTVVSTTSILPDCQATNSCLPPPPPQNWTWIIIPLAIAAIVAAAVLGSKKQRRR